MSDPSEVPHRYRRRLNDVVALQYDGSAASLRAVERFAGKYVERNEFGHAWINSPVGPNKLTAGDFVCTAGPDAFYVIGAENFSRAYDVASRKPER